MYRQLVTGNKIQGKYLEESGRVENMIDMGEVDQSEVEESDLWRLWIKGEITPIFHTIVTILTYEHPPTTSFNPLYTP